MQEGLENEIEMIFLRDIKTKFNKKFIALALVCGILGVVSPMINGLYGIILAIFFFILSFFFALFANYSQKDFGANFQDTIPIKESFHGVARDKDGNIKAERHSL